MSAGRVIGVDVGTSSVKAIAVDESGAVVGSADRSYPVAMEQPGWSEQDPALWWEACESALQELEADRCDGIGLSGQMHGLVALDGSDAPLRPAILWNDGRSQPQVDALLDEVGVARLVELSGNRPLAGFTAPKLLWLAEHEPELRARIRRIMLPKDYVRLRLTGEAACEVTDASGTLLLDVEHRRWSEPLCEVFGVDPAWLPPVHESSAVVGRTRAGVPVAAGAGDQAAGALGVGVIDAAGPASLVLGTSGVIFAAQDAYAADPEGRLHEFCHALEGRWHVMGVILAAAGALAWLDSAVGHGDGIPALLQEAAAWPAGSEGLLFAPYLSGERTPHPDSDVRGGFVGLGLRHDRGAMVRAVLEGVAHALRDGLDLIHSTGARPASARVSGGGARSELWCEILAAVLDLPLEHTASASAGAAYGAALLGGVAGGLFSDPAAAASATVRVTGEVAPDPALVEAYAAQRERYQALYPALAAFKPEAASWR
ncbi:MAG TPA: xylulokinase [Solirubrobacteraceae bacterium]|nr:xylulokinase [Solirubrobacteraceae bacterium]